MWTKEEELIKMFYGKINLDDPNFRNSEEFLNLYNQQISAPNIHDGVFKIKVFDRETNVNYSEGISCFTKRSNCDNTKIHLYNTVELIDYFTNLKTDTVKPIIDILRDTSKNSTDEEFYDLAKKYFRNLHIEDARITFLDLFCPKKYLVNDGVATLAFLIWFFTYNLTGKLVRFEDSKLS